MNDTSSSIFDLDFVREKVADIYRKIGATRDYVTFGNPRYDATPDVDIKSAYDFVTGINGTPIPRKLPRKSYTFITRERGDESRDETSDLDELLYWIFKGVTFSMAADFEVAHRKENEDFRRILFSKQIELLSQLSPEWALRMAEEHNRTLQHHPFDDNKN